MTLSFTRALILLLSLHTCSTVGGRAQRRQRQAEVEESLRPYIGRVQPEKLCELLKCSFPVGSWCQVVEEKGDLVPKCRGRQCAALWARRIPTSVCCTKKPAEREDDPVWPTPGPVWAKCSDEELGQFPYRLLDWFLLLSRMGRFHTPATPPQRCLSHTQRTRLAQERFTLLDRNQDGKLSRRDLRKLRYKRMPLEHCAPQFFKSCDYNRNKKVTLTEWTSCLVDRSEAWFYRFMSVKMGSGELCPSVKDNNV